MNKYFDYEYIPVTILGASYKQARPAPLSSGNIFLVKKQR